MKKKLVLFIGLSVAIICRAQQVIHLANGTVLSIQNNTEVSLKGGITLEEGSRLVNNGTLRLKNNPLANQSDWLDNSTAGALEGQGTIIFNSENGHHFTGATTFNNLHMNANGGLGLNNNMIITNAIRLINGKINTGSNFVFINNSNPASLENDASNTGYINSWVNGNLRYSVTVNTSVYNFPVGTATRSNVLQFINNNIAGINQLTASFINKPGTDAGLNVSENSLPYTAVNDAGVWILTPDANPTAGNYALQVYFNGFTGLSDNQFGILRRPDASSSAVDWQVPAGSLLETTGGAGRKVSDAYARRFNISDFSQFGIGSQGSSCPDADNDGYLACEGDCDDDNANINPAATEVCNGIDDDCDGLIDDADPSVTDQPTWYADIDNDGYGNSASSLLACARPEGYVDNSDDCNDNDANIHPNAAEVCNGFDDNCDGVIDNDASGQSTWYADADNDGYGNPSLSVQACTQPSGYVVNADDCNDAKGQIHPGANEVCNGVDDDCDGQVDEGCATVSIDDLSVFESGGVANLIVRLSQAINLPVKINYKTIDGTALSSGRNKDYKGVGNGSITIPAGQISAIITISILTDNLNESAEYFDLLLTKASSALLGDNSGRVTIHDGTTTIITGIEKSRMTTSCVGNMEVIAYPNPSATNFKIEVRTNTTEKITMQVVDAYGRVTDTRNVSANSMIRLGDRYRPGTYFIRVMQGKQHQVLKLVKLSD